MLMPTVFPTVCEQETLPRDKKPLMTERLLPL